jgi:REP element-mobilizing transposase RayT
MDNSTTKNTLLKRKSIRLRNYDYSQCGAYFITVCTEKRKCIFGDITNGKMILNNCGIIAEKELLKLNNETDVNLESYVIMPNHIHMIFEFPTDVGAIHELPSKMSIKERRKMKLPKVVGKYKMLASKEINMIRKTPGKKLWQRNYWDHIIRDENDFNVISEYVENNPTKWDLDKLNPVNQVLYKGNS